MQISQCWSWSLLVPRQTSKLELKLGFKALEDLQSCCSGALTCCMPGTAQLPQVLLATDPSETTLQLLACDLLALAVSVSSSIDCKSFCLGSECRKIASQ